MPKNEEIHIFFEGQLIIQYPESKKQDTKSKPTFGNVGDSHTENEYHRRHIFCDSCKQEVVNFCPECGDSNIVSEAIGYACLYCFNTFSSDDILKEHQVNCIEFARTNTPLVGFIKCPFCQKLKLEEILYIHLKVCGERYASKNKAQTSTPITIKYKGHDLSNGNDTQMSNVKFLDVGVYMHRNNSKATPLRCRLCDQVSWSKSTLKKHIVKSHKTRRSTN